jgi:hypothetical protein
MPCLGEQLLGLSHLAALGVKHRQRAQRREARPVHGSGAVQFLRLGPGPGRLQDHRPLGLQGGAIAPAAIFGGVKVGERVGEAVEGGPRPRPGQQGRAVAGRAGADELLGEFRCPLVVGDAAQDLAPQGEQIDQDEPVRRQPVCRLRLWRRAQGPRRQAVDLRVQIDHGDRAAGGGRLAVAAGGLGHPMAGWDTGGRSNGGVRGGGLGFGAAR